MFKTRAEINSDADTLLPNNTTGDISAEDVRQRVKDLADSAVAAINPQTGVAYTLVLADTGKVVTMDNALANTLTIPTNAAVAFPIATIISVLQVGAGVTSIVGDTGVTLNGVSAGSGALDGQWKGVSLVKIAADEWIMSGAHAAVA